MTKNQFRQILERYALTQGQAGKLFGGVRRRASARWAGVEGTVPYSVALAIALMEVCKFVPADLEGLVEKFWGRKLAAKQDLVDTLQGKLHQSFRAYRFTDVNLDVAEPDKSEAVVASSNPGAERHHIPAASPVREDQDRSGTTEGGLFAGF